MKVSEIMTTEVKPCDLNASLAEAAKAMWDYDCGIIPVLKDGKEIVGVITDRDICIGAATRDRSPASISIEEVITGQVFSVMPDDEMEKALETMRQHKVRRLPVVDEEGKLKGLLTLNDVVLNAKENEGKKGSSIVYADVIKTFQAICQHPVGIAKTANAAE